MWHACIRRTSFINGQHCYVKKRISALVGYGVQGCVAGLLDGLLDVWGNLFPPPFFFRGKQAKAKSTPDFARTVRATEPWGRCTKCCRQTPTDGEAKARTGQEAGVWIELISNHRACKVWCGVAGGISKGVGDTKGAGHSLTWCQGTSMVCFRADQKTNSSGMTDGRSRMQKYLGGGGGGRGRGVC